MQCSTSFFDTWHEAELMLDGEDIVAPGFTTSPWTPEGIATISAVGQDMRSVLEVGLRAVLALVVTTPPTQLNAGRAAPIRGEGDELQELFADLVQDLLDQIEYFGSGLNDVAVDGLLRREDGGYVSWGYASGTLGAVSTAAVPHLLGAPTASEDASQGLVLRATLQRP
jgi:hypothetical protein